MSTNPGILERVRVAARKKILFLPHAVEQMSRPDHMISPSEIRQVIETGRLIEDYPEDHRGHSCLILGHGEEKRPIHVVCSPKPQFLAIITAYLPDQRQWEQDFDNRKKL